MNINSYRVGDRVCIYSHNKGYVIGSVDTQARTYDLIDLSSGEVVPSIDCETVWRYFRVGDRVESLEGRAGVVIGVNHNSRIIEVVFDYPSKKQINCKKRYRKTPDGKFITNVDRNSLRVIDCYNNVSYSSGIEFDEDMFLKMIGGL